MRIDVLTLFPDYFDVLTRLGVTSRALSRGLWSLNTWNPRDFVQDVHRTVDDRPYGGGPGMVMLAAPLIDALSAARQSRGDPQAKVILMAPGGRRFDQSLALELSQSVGAIFVCGRYEGIDQRFIDHYVDEQWSVGDYVLSGGEPALLPMLDASIRLIPGALNHGESHGQDSFQESLDGLLDCPHYTRPELLDGESVPAVLLSGHHERIRKWRREQSLLLTLIRRPDLLDLARQKGLLSETDEGFLRSVGR